MQSSELSQRLSNLHSEAEEIVIAMNVTPGDPGLVEKLDSLFHSIEEVEAFLDVCESKSSSSGSNPSHVSTKCSRLMKMLSHLQRLCPIGTKMGSMFFVEVTPALIKAFCDYGKASSKLTASEFIGLVSVAERPDFSQVQLSRRCLFESASEDGSEIEIARLFSVLQSAQNVSNGNRSESVRVDIASMELTCHVSPHLTGVALALVTMGFGNKLEQLFSPTSVINKMARVCRNIGRSMLMDFMVLESLEGATSFADIVFPQYNRTLPLHTIVNEAIKMGTSDYDEFGRSIINPANIRVENIGEAIVNGFSVIGLVFFLRALSYQTGAVVSQGDKACELRILSANNDALCVVDEASLSAASTFLKHIERLPLFTLIEC
jgi:hypothetical protein